VVAALRAPWPMLACAVDEPPAPGVRPFAEVADVRRAADVLARLTVRVALVESLGVDLVAMSQAPEPRPALDDHARTAVCRAAAGGELSGAALSQAELAGFRATLEDGRVGATARQRAHAAVEAQLARAGLGRATVAAALVDGWLGDLEQILGAVEGEIDPRFVEGVLVALQRS